MLEQMILYIRENTLLVSLAVGAVTLFLLLLVFIQVTRTRCEVHKICKKVQKYLDVIFAEDGSEDKAEEPANEEVSTPVYQTPEECQKQQEAKKKAEEDAKLLIDVISEVF